MDNYLIIAILLGLGLLLCIVLLLQSKKEKKELANELGDLNANFDNLMAEKNALSKYQSCIDAEAEAARIIKAASDFEFSSQTKAQAIIRQANQDAISIKAEADKILVDVRESEREARSTARSIVKEAKDKAQSIKDEAIAYQASATRRAADIVSAAENEARRIAGSAYEIAEKADDYKKMAASMKNIIEGYGSRYLKPTESILDGLASEFGYTEAGRELSRVRAVRAQLSDSLVAATCDYVEKNRHDTAVRFIIDAFNGKVDSILSMIKIDNIGILEQKIKDAYTLVNYLGAAFRDTKITPEYLNECLDELKWAAAVIALKNKEREEQRVIKEQLREEQRARREYERAIRDAEKQESAIRKAIEKATAQLEKANEEQKIKYESQLHELEAQLLEAEAKNQRALSMAQQTKSGHVYIISNIGSFGENVYKIGMTRRLEPTDRVRELGDASVPFPFDVHAMIFSEDAPALETELHRLFARNQVNKVNPRKEFFRLPIAAIRDYIDGKGINAHWTITAEAAQYRETLAMEKAFAQDETLENAWAIQQEESILSQPQLNELDYAEE